eukprot:6463362-Amphidinium_carterae.1
MIFPSKPRRSKSSGSATYIFSRKASHDFSSSTLSKLDRVTPDPSRRARLRPSPIQVIKAPFFQL